MEERKNIKHNFDISDYKNGDKFLGCPNCGWSLHPGEAQKPICPNCMTSLNLYTVGEEYKRIE
jgi:rubrerythrin